MNHPHPPLAADELAAFWMPFTANADYKRSARMIVSASGMYYRTTDDRSILDATAGLWCVACGHGRAEIADAVSAQLRELDFAPTFQLGHPGPFRLASRIARMAPGNLNHVFFTNSGSEGVDTALKIALAYHRARGESSRQRLIGRERAYHGVNIGGLSVSGIGNNRKQFGLLVGGTDHLPHTHDPAHGAFSRGQPSHGAHFADALERLVALHDASNIAAVIVEPVAGATGVLPPPQGYLQRLREICTRHGILLIFDEVVTGFGRTGNAFAAQTFGVEPDMIVFAKAVTNAAIPMGGVIVSKAIYDTFVTGANGVEMFHGYTYSGHPVAAAAAHATLSIFESEGLFARTAELSPYWEEMLHALAVLPHVTDIRNLGLLGAIDLAPRNGAPGARAWDAHRECWSRGILVRAAGDTLVMSPPLVINRAEIDRIGETLRTVLSAVA